MPSEWGPAHKISPVYWAKSKTDEGGRWHILLSKSEAAFSTGAGNGFTHYWKLNDQWHVQASGPNPDINKDILRSQNNPVKSDFAGKLDNLFQQLDVHNQKQHAATSEDKRQHQIQRDCDFNDLKRNAELVANQVLHETDTRKSTTRLKALNQTIRDADLTHKQRKLLKRIAQQGWDVVHSQRDERKEKQGQNAALVRKNLDVALHDAEHAPDFELTREMLKKSSRALSALDLAREDRHQLRIQLNSAFGVLNDRQDESREVKQQKVFVAAIATWIVGIATALIFAQLHLMISAIYIGLLVIMGAITFDLYRIDKRSAQSGKWRIPEATLHTSELLGGWMGAIFAQQYFRHKTRKASYIIVFRIIMFLHIVIIVVIVVQLLYPELFNTYLMLFQDIFSMGQGW